MTGRLWTLAVACSLASLTACTSNKSDTPTTQGAPAPAVRVSVSTPTVIANGTNTVTVSVTNTGTGAVTVSTDRGLFTGGQSSMQVTGTFGTLTLFTCDASVAGNGCAGTATITATGAAGTSQATVTFTSTQSACQTNCAAAPNCATLACNLAAGGTGVCSGTTPSACVAGSACTPTPAGTTSEAGLCSDGLDNDCNGNIDCKDTACDGQPCRAGFPTFVCKASACTDITSGLAVTVTPARTRLPADGVAQTDVVVEVTSGSDPVTLATVTVATTLGTIAPAARMTGTDGKAHFTFTSSAAAGVATITATFAAVPSIQGTALVTIPRLGALQLVGTNGSGSVEFPVMGAVGSGWQEFGSIQVMAVDDIGLPYPDGLAVRFEHQTLGGSTLRGPLTADTGTCLAAGGCVGYAGAVDSGSGTPDTTGLAQAWIYSGRVAGTLAVTASATAGGISRTVSLPTIAVIGAKASGASLAVECSPRNLPALAETDCAVSLVDAPFTCEAILKDRFSNVLGRPTQVIFYAEASAVGLVATTNAYNPASPGSEQMDLGLAVQGFNTLGAPLPFDVDPLTTLGEPSVVHGLDGCGLRTHNPRDGVLTIIAVADGEEAYFDANGNGSYDAGEPFVDLGEPFIDQNDNGVWDPGEWFLDLDGNGTWTPPNGRWDANTKIWAQTYVVYTGPAATLLDGGGNLLGTRIADFGTFADACVGTPPPTPFDVRFATTALPATSEDYVVVASDMNLNFLQTKASYSVDVLPKATDVKVDYSGLASHADLTGLSFRYWPCANGGAGPCASQCRGPGACLMVPQFTAFSCGLTSTMTITGGNGPASGTARWSVDVPWDRYGTGVIQTDRATVSGISH